MRKCETTCTAPLGSCCYCSEALCQHLLKTWDGRTWCVECFPEAAS